VTFGPAHVSLTSIGTATALGATLLIIPRRFTFSPELTTISSAPLGIPPIAHHIRRSHLLGSVESNSELEVTMSTIDDAGA
jgi:hypothetical protein